MELNPAVSSYSHSADRQAESLNASERREQLEQACEAWHEGRGSRVQAYQALLEFFDASISDTQMSSEQQALTNQILRQAELCGPDRNPFEQLPRLLPHNVSAPAPVQVDSPSQPLGLAVFEDSAQGPCVYFDRTGGVDGFSNAGELLQSFPWELDITPSPAGNSLNALLDIPVQHWERRNAVAIESGRLLLGQDVGWGEIERRGQDAMLAELNRLAEAFRMDERQIKASVPEFILDAQSEWRSFFRAEHPTRFREQDAVFNARFEDLETAQPHLDDGLYRFYIEQLSCDKDKDEINVFKQLVSEFFAGVEITHL
ncbi:hypothetical protein [Pseudomonas rubra]|uniref:Uncharacterized protein n=1 Tax=Pseudomonas rubra TaxID=2942627 RepID=A0ABT5PAF6_9PSED|nr:hypothetical protein [Pseudomonas rubra]MDD1015152.1 hypothetical protein [Pseudomonas rubra]MDD1037731.1 hypothetical protein [Pseudomonas rubra]MDD1157349.1 hypothetical protein [Pseudomonas rubra]